LQKVANTAQTACFQRLPGHCREEDKGKSRKIEEGNLCYFVAATLVLLRRCLRYRAQLPLALRDTLTNRFLATAFRMKPGTLPASRSASALARPHYSASHLAYAQPVAIISTNTIQSRKTAAAYAPLPW
jgi:hypothetical protein